MCLTFVRYQTTVILTYTCNSLSFHSVALNVDKSTVLDDTYEEY